MRKNLILKSQRQVVIEKIKKKSTKRVISWACWGTRKLTVNQSSCWSDRDKLDSFGKVSALSMDIFFPHCSPRNCQENGECFSCSKHHRTWISKSVNKGDAVTGGETKGAKSSIVMNWHSSLETNCAALISKTKLSSVEQWAITTAKDLAKNLIKGWRKGSDMLHSQRATNVVFVKEKQGIKWEEVREKMK